MKLLSFDPVTNDVKQRQMNALILLGNGQQMQRNYVEAFGASGSDPFFDILI